SVVEIPRLEFSGVAVGYKPHSPATVPERSRRAAGHRPHSAATVPERSRRAEPEWMRPGSVDNLAIPEEATAAAIRASDVREALKEGSFRTAAALTPPSTWPYLVAELMARALRMELDTPLKPGLVDKDSNGAHADMDYALMSGSIEVIRRSFIRHLPMLLRRESTADSDIKSIMDFGKAIEADVMEYTGGVNTYRGAIFALGLAALSALDVACNSQLVDYQTNSPMCLVNNNQTLFANALIDSFLHFTAAELSVKIAALSGLLAPGNDSHGANAVKEYGVKGALQLAQEGYKPLFEDWLPYYRCAESAAGAAGIMPHSAAASEAKREWTRPCPDSTAALRLRSGTVAAEYGLSTAALRLRSGIKSCGTLQKTLLRIMSTLDDTCVIHRVGYERAQEVKNEAEALLDNFSEEGLREMKKRYDAEGISPGGAADMLALTILIDSLTN
ncbi:MAG: triphosphoribosyl-dephospho-CoA synthase, partial [Bacteroidales bacterium]|nr:triphosphoribosyl-dephospho-CoA synthase [Bacteroidales bacterium]